MPDPTSKIPARQRYAHSAQIVRIVAAARACGLDVAAIEVSPDGVIRVMEARADTKTLTSFDRWESEL